MRGRGRRQGVTFGNSQVVAAAPVTSTRHRSKAKSTYQFRRGITWASNSSVICLRLLAAGSPSGLRTARSFSRSSSSIRARIAAKSSAARGCFIIVLPWARRAYAEAVVRQQCDPIVKRDAFRTMSRPRRRFSDAGVRVLKKFYKKLIAPKTWAHKYLRSANSVAWHTHCAMCLALWPRRQTTITRSTLLLNPPHHHDNGQTTTARQAAEALFAPKGRTTRAVPRAGGRGRAQAAYLGCLAAGTACHG
jgi:hypothetical protein